MSHLNSLNNDGWSALPKRFTAPLPVAPGSHSASKPHFEVIAVMLDTTRAVSPSTRHSPFKLDDRSMSSAPYDAIARAHRMEPPTCMIWLDPGPPLTQHSISRMQAHVPCTRPDAERIEGEEQSASASTVSTSQRALCAHRSPSQLHFDVVQRHPSCESASRRGCGLELGLRSQLASIIVQSVNTVILSRTGGNAPTAFLSDRPFPSQHLGTVSEEDGAARGRDPDT
ncbi:hypothetical protein C8J57DRAFT_1540044 [Mycena rebaudengoi]|nr:hypothetical protein C8J57DRAFT_1540044 [Mycena rebaudengoi]